MKTNRTVIALAACLLICLDVNGQDDTAAVRQQAERWRSERRLIDVHMHIEPTPERLARAVKIMDQAGIGIAVGVAGALALSRITQSLLYGVDPADPATFGTVVGVIAVVATAACIIPMRRATRVDPLTAIRAD